MRSERRQRDARDDNDDHDDDADEGYDAAPDETPLQLAKAESRAVWCLRLTTLSILFLTAVRAFVLSLHRGVKGTGSWRSRLIYIDLTDSICDFVPSLTHACIQTPIQTCICWIILEEETKSQREAYEDAFDTHAAQILSAVAMKSLVRYNALGSFSQDMTSFALARQRFTVMARTTNTTSTTATSSSSSFLNIPNYARKAFATVQSAGVVGLIWTPVVSSQELSNWNAYSVENSDWIDEDQSFLTSNGQALADSPLLSTIAAAQQGVEGLDRPSATDIPPAVFGWDGSGAATLAGTESSSSSYMPVWQFYPAPADPSLVNCDMLSYPFYAGSLRKMVDEKATVLLSRAYTMGDWFPAKILQMLLPETPLTEGDGPVSNLYIPIYDKFQRNTNKVVGVLTSHLIWKTFLENTLPLGSPAPLTVVLVNSCGQNYTFQVEGVSSTFLGYAKIYPDHDTVARMHD